ncbi:hypothetical protein CW357_11490 [Rummeliibacillus sp. TYF005]|uniref:hypothetical protein n=1 Tax=Rummeliibacillus sp. TYF005 TaxID=2058214 RepID=UPI000F52D92C|nr:hypothetical protein [Rummeliibacillus sp. TYF005]RPJ95229.1 hypothetical protein CW357_11490 [Rummeliibacillus sp. TYF005]
MKTIYLNSIIGVVVVALMLIGGAIGIYIIGNTTNEYPWDLMIPAIVGAVGGMVIFLAISMWREKRNGNIPSYDERTIKNLQKYFMVVLYFTLTGSGLALIIAFAMGIKTIETGLLIFILTVLFSLVGLGSLVVKRL